MAELVSTSWLTVVRKAPKDSYSLSAVQVKKDQMVLASISIIKKLFDYMSPNPSAFSMAMMSDSFIFSFDPYSGRRRRLKHV